MYFVGQTSNKKAGNPREIVGTGNPWNLFLVNCTQNLSTNDAILAKLLVNSWKETTPEINDVYT